MPAMISSNNGHAAGTYSRHCSYTSKPPQQQPHPKPSHHARVLRAAATLATVDDPAKASPPPSRSIRSLKLPEFPKLPAAIAGLGFGGGKQQKPEPAKKAPVALPKRAYRWDDDYGSALPSAMNGDGRTHETRDECLRRVQRNGTRSEGSSPTHAHQRQRAAAVSSRRSSADAGGRSSAIPLPATHVRRTASELQLRDDMAEAERRDWAMYARCVVRGGINGTPNPTPPPPPLATPLPLVMPQQPPAPPHPIHDYVEEPHFGLPLEDEDLARPRPENHHCVPCNLQQHVPLHQAAHVYKPVPVKVAAVHARAPAYLMAALEPQDYAARTYPSYHHTQHQDYATAAHEEEEGSGHSHCLFDMDL